MATERGIGKTCKLSAKERPQFSLLNEVLNLRYDVKFLKHSADYVDTKAKMNIMMDKITLLKERI